jgi:hypothetical protein
VYRFKISYQTATINADGTLNINSTIHDILYDADNTYIDPAVTYDKARGLLMAYKDEVNGKVHFRIMNSPTSLTSNDYTCPVYGIEACQLLSNDSGTMCYVDCYGLTNNQVTGGLNISGGRTAYIDIPTSGSIQAKNLGLMSVLRPFHLRHPGLMYASEKAYNIVLQLGIKPSTLYYADNVNSLENGTYFVSIGSATNPVLINLPDVVYTVASNKTIKALPFFRDTPLKLYNRKNRAITWSSDSWANSDTVNHTFTPNSDGFMYIPANSNDCLAGMWLPIDRT